MFVHYYTHVPVAMADVESRLDEVRAHLEDLAGVVYRDGEELYAKVGPADSDVAKTVRLEIGVPEIRRAGLVYPVSWTAVGAVSLFPRLTADLIISHVGTERTKIALEGRYEPPLGALGRAVDRTILKQVAESTVQDWVDRVAEAVSSQEVS